MDFIRNILAKVEGFIEKFVPSFIDLGDVVEEVAKKVDVGLSAEEAAAVLVIADVFDEQANIFEDGGKELRDVARELREAVDPEGPNGKAIDLIEGKEIAMELYDFKAFGPRMKQNTADMIAAIRELT